MQEVRHRRIFLEFGAFHRLQMEETAMSKREMVDTGSDKWHVRRDPKGRFSTSVDVGRSLSADKRHKAKGDAKPGEGDRGDHRSKKH